MHRFPHLPQSLEMSLDFMEWGGCLSVCIHRNTYVASCCTRLLVELQLRWLWHAQFCVCLSVRSDVPLVPRWPTMLTLPTIPFPTPLCSCSPHSRVQIPCTHVSNPPHHMFKLPTLLCSDSPQQRVQIAHTCVFKFPSLMYQNRHTNVFKFPTTMCSDCPHIHVEFLTFTYQNPHSNMFKLHTLTCSDCPHLQSLLFLHSHVGVLTFVPLASSGLVLNQYQAGRPSVHCQ